MLQSQPFPLVADEAEGEIELSILVPVHNEEKSIAPLVERICGALKHFDRPWELIIVDDGSTDATLVNARKELAREGLDLRIVELQRNFGQAAALQAGIDVARGRLLATLDGDLQNDPEDIPKMIAMLEERELDLLCGWRKDRQDGLVLRLIPSWVANRLIRKVTGVKVHDYGCGLKIYRTDILKQVRIMGGMHRFTPALIASVVPTSRIDEMVVNHHARQFGLSKYGISRTFRVVLDLLSVVFFMSFRHRPGHFFGVIGLTFGAISGLLFFYLFLVKFLLGQDIGTRPMLIVAVMLFVAAAQMITTGILAEILARPDSETRNYFIRNSLRARQMIDRLARHPGAVYLLLAAYFTVNVLLRLAGPASLELDEGQQLFFAQWLAVGYDSQPPFYNWLQYGVAQVLGSSVLAVSLLKNLLLFLSYLLFGLTAHLVIRDRVLAVIATLALITIPQVGYEAQRDLTHTVAVLFAACMFAYFFVRALLKPTALDYALTGVAIGIGVLSKYNFVVLPSDRSARPPAGPPTACPALRPPHPAHDRGRVAIVAPHAVWFLDHISEATGRTVLKLTVGADGGRLDQIGTGLLSLVGRGRGLHAADDRRLRGRLRTQPCSDSWKAESQWTRLIGRMFVMAFVVLCFWCCSAEPATSRTAGWCRSSSCCRSICARRSKRPAKPSAGASRRFGAIVLAIMVLVPLVLFARPA